MNCRTVLLVCLFCICSPALADKPRIAWGKPVGGIQLGIVCKKTKITSLEDPVFDVYIRNVSKKTLTIPKPDGLMPAHHKDHKVYYECPLQPVVETVQGKRWFGYPHQDEDAPSRRPSEVAYTTIGAGKTITLPKRKLSAGEYADGRYYRENYVLIAPRRFRVQFALRNDLTKIAGKPPWVGKALTEAVLIEVRPPWDLSKIKETFSVDQSTFIPGEAVYLRIALKNTGKASFDYTCATHRGPFGKRLITFKATGPDGKELKRSKASRMMIWNGPVPTFSIGGNDTLDGNVILNYWFDLSKPGKYEVQYKFSVQIRKSLDDNCPMRGPRLPFLEYEGKVSFEIVDSPKKTAAYAAELSQKARGERTTELEERLSYFAKGHPVAAWPVVRQSVIDMKAPLDLLKHFPQEKATVAAILRTAIAKGNENAFYILTKFAPETCGKDVAVALQSKDKAWREGGVIACTEYAYPNCLPILLKMVDDPVSDVRRCLPLALAKHKDQKEKVIPALLTMLKDPSRDLRIHRWTASVLKDLGRNDGIPVLIELLKDPKNSYFKRDITYTLAELTGEKFGGNPKNCLLWWDDEGIDIYGTKTKP